MSSLWSSLQSKSILSTSSENFFMYGTGIRVALFLITYDSQSMCFNYAAQFIWLLTSLVKTQLLSYNCTGYIAFDATMLSYCVLILTKSFLMPSYLSQSFSGILCLVSFSIITIGCTSSNFFYTLFTYDIISLCATSLSMCVVLTYRFFYSSTNLTMVPNFMQKVSLTFLSRSVVMLCQWRISWRVKSSSLNSLESEAEF